MPRHITTPNRFLAFAYTGEGDGGARDFVGCSDTLEGARRVAKESAHTHYNILDVAVVSRVEEGLTACVLDDGTLREPLGAPKAALEGPPVQTAPAKPKKTAPKP